MAPIENQTLNPDGQGYRQRFMNGFIYYHPTTGAHAVTNRNAQVWERNGWESGWMGYPTGGEVPVSGVNPVDGELNGWMQTFQGGRVYRSPVLDGFQVASINGLILDKWLALGGPNSDLGFPIADEAVASDGIGRFSIFQNGVIYWHPGHGAWEIAGFMGEVWKMRGGVASEWGYPISAPVISPDAPVAISQEFSGGELNLSDLVTESGVTSIGGKEVTNLLVEYLDFRGLEMPETGSSSVASLESQRQQNISALKASLGSKKDSSADNFGGVTIPSSYDYWGCMKKKDTPDPSKFGRHDYCSNSPDEFPSPGRNAEFSGGCARHDMCMDSADAQNSGYGSCNSRLFDDLAKICAANYGVLDPRYTICANTAGGYWSAVTAFHVTNL